MIIFKVFVVFHIGEWLSVTLFILLLLFFS